jgi:hypothetical protein
MLQLIKTEKLVLNLIFIFNFGVSGQHAHLILPNIVKVKNKVCNQTEF